MKKCHARDNKSFAKLFALCKKPCLISRPVGISSKPAQNRGVHILHKHHFWFLSRLSILIDSFFTCSCIDMYTFSLFITLFLIIYVEYECLLIKTWCKKGSLNLFIEYTNRALTRVSKRQIILRRNGFSK